MLKQAVDRIRRRGSQLVVKSAADIRDVRALWLARRIALENEAIIRRRLASMG